MVQMQRFTGCARFCRRLAPLEPISHMHSDSGLWLGFFEGPQIPSNHLAALQMSRLGNIGVSEPMSDDSSIEEPMSDDSGIEE